MKLQAVSNRKLYIQIADQIRDQIAAGAVEPGAPLPSERDLAAALGVSRPTVREALIALEVAGLVEVRVGVGAFVRKLETKSAALPELSHSPLEVMAVRRLLEPEAAALASQAADADTRKALSAIVETMRAEAGRGVWSADSDRALHLTIAEMAGNLVLRDLLEMLWASRSGVVDRQFHQHLADIAEVRAHILADHDAVVTAIGTGNAEAARAAMTRHLDYVARAMTDVWENPEAPGQ